MAKYKCSECGGEAVALCVERVKLYCKKCVGRVFHPSLKVARDLTLEGIDNTHTNVVTLTKAIMYSSVTFGGLWCLWSAGLGADYLQGRSTCPALSVLRQGLARWDANVFYYYKPSLAFYCDIEDSFWRLLMDGWMRGVVAGSDSLLLLAATLPKAWFFKVAVTTFLGPIYTVLYAVIALTLTFFFAAEQDLSKWLWDHFHGFLPKKPAAEPSAAASSDAPAAAAEPTRFAFLKDEKTAAQVKAKLKVARGWTSKLFRLPRSLYAAVTTKRDKSFMQARQLFLALAASSLLRLLVHYAGWKKLAAVGEVNMWQLIFEPALFFYLAQLCSSFQASLGKTLWKQAAKTGAQSAVVPLTFRRTRPYKDLTDVISYNKMRVKHVYDNYKRQAQELLHILVDETFNVVIVLRLVGIIFKTAPLVRQVLSSIGFGSILRSQRERVLEATGFVDSDLAPSYFSDNVFTFGVQELLAGLSFATHSLESVWDADGNGVVSAQDVLQSRHYFLNFGFWQQMAWRLLVPFLIWSGEQAWTGLRKKWHRAYEEEWVGPADENGKQNWTNGQYAEVMEKYGSYWNQVKTKEEWLGCEEPAKREQAVAPTFWSKLLDKACEKVAALRKAAAEGAAGPEAAPAS